MSNRVFERDHNVWNHVDGARAPFSSFLLLLITLWSTAPHRPRCMPAQACLFCPFDQNQVVLRAQVRPSTPQLRIPQHLTAQSPYLAWG